MNSLNAMGFAVVTAFGIANSDNQCFAQQRISPFGGVRSAFPQSCVGTGTCRPCGNSNVRTFYERYSPAPRFLMPRGFQPSRYDGFQPQYQLRTPSPYMMLRSPVPRYYTPTFTRPVYQTRPLYNGPAVAPAAVPVTPRVIPSGYYSVPLTRKPPLRTPSVPESTSPFYS